MITCEGLKKFADENRQMFRTDTLGNLTLFKYSKRTHFKSLWNEYTTECRGLVMDEKFNIVSYPFSKFFNDFEPCADKFSDDEIVYAARKYNGFLAIVTVHEGKLLCHTAGSLNNEYVDRIRRYVNDAWIDILDDNYTYMFECVCEDDPHVTIENYGLTLIGYRQKEFGSEVFYRASDLRDLANRLGCRYARGLEIKMSELRDLLKDVGFEGFVIHSMDGKRTIKMKSPHFLRKRFLANLTEKNYNVLEGDLEQFDEEFFGIIRYIREHKEEWLAMDHDLRVHTIRVYFNDKVD